MKRRSSCHLGTSDGYYSDTALHLHLVVIDFSLPSPFRVAQHLSVLQFSPFPPLSKTLMEDAA